MGEEERRAWRSRSFEVIYSLIRRNQEAELEQRLAQNKTSLRMSLGFLHLASIPEQQRKVCSWKAAPLQPFLPCFRYMPPTATLLPAAGQGLKPVSCIKIHVENITSILLEFSVVVVVGGKGDFFFLLPLLVFIVECIKRSKANFRLTKFKNYFLCSYVFV